MSCECRVSLECESGQGGGSVYTKATSTLKRVQHAPNTCARAWRTVGDGGGRALCPSTDQRPRLRARPPYVRHMEREGEVQRS